MSQAVFRTANALEGTGEPVNIAVAGLLLRSGVVPPAGTELWVHFSGPGRPGKFIAAARVVRSHPDCFAVMFSEEPAGLRKFLESLSPITPQAEEWTEALSDGGKDRRT